MPTHTFKRFADAEEFRQLAEPWLLSNEAAHCLQLGLLGGMTAGEWRDKRFMAVVFDGDEPALIALRTPPHALILSACSSPAAIAVLQAAIKELSADEQPGEVMGPADVADEFRRLWTGTPATEPAAEPSERERIYRLDTVNPVTGVAGEPKRAGDADRELLVDWFTRFHAEAVPDQPFDPEETVGRWLANPERRQLWFWLVDAQPVSLAGAGNPTQHGIRLGPVFTPKDRRAQGYASALVAWLSQRLLDSGRDFCTLFTDLKNPTSNHIYSVIGYRPVVDIHKHKLH